MKIINRNEWFNVINNITSRDQIQNLNHQERKVLTHVIKTFENQELIKIKNSVDLEVIRKKLSKESKANLSCLGKIIRIVTRIFDLFHLRENSQNVWNLVKNFRGKPIYAKGYSIKSISQGIRMNVLRKKLKEDPRELFSELMKIISNDIGSFPCQTEVKFISENFLSEAAADAGGPSREFFHLMMEGLLKNMTSITQQVESTQYLFLKAKENYKMGEFPKLTTEENTVLENIGKLMMYCYESSRDVSLGTRFHPALFRASLSLTTEEAKKPFHELSQEVHLKMCKALVEGLREEGMAVEHIEKRFEYLSQIEQWGSNQNHDEDLKIEILQLLILAGIEPQQYVKDGNIDIEKARSISKEEIRKLLIESILLPNGGHVQFGSQLPAIHAIATGMNVVSPNYGIYRDYKDFNNKVQGLVDRTKIVEKIKATKSRFLSESHRQEIEKKTDWLREWILDSNEGATDDQIKKFLIYATGSGSLIMNRNLTIEAQITNFEPAIKAHTCSFFLEVSPVPCGTDEYNDHTKENFIKCLKELALQSEGFDTV